MMALLDERNQSAKAGRRTSRSRTMRTISVLLMLVFTTIGGPVTFADDTPDPTPTFESLSPVERQLLEESLADVGPWSYPYAETGYPGALPAIAPTAPRDAIAASTDVLGSWSNEKLCLGGEQCLIGDFNGDKRDDVAVLYRDTRPDPDRGDVWVALSGGSHFTQSSKWLDGVCTGNHLCKAGDANNDGKDDLIIFHRGWGEPGTGYVDVAISTGSSFATPVLWHAYFCIGDQVCDVGNFDGYNGDDLILFVRSSANDPFRGDVLVARSNGTNAFAASERWADFFCIGQEECRVGDFNGDNRDDIAFFVKSGDGQGRFGVSLSSGGSFGGASDWAKYFCVNDEQCEIGDFDGDGRDDGLAFLKAGYDAGTYGDTYVTLSTGGSFYNSQRWSDTLCVPGEECRVGDFNGDGRTDVIRFVKQSADPSRVGLVLVALAAGSPTGFFPTPAPGGLWLSSFCTGSQSCLTGDFNGDGRDDVAYLVRSTQLGAVEGDVYVALSDGIQFGTPTKWHDYFCVGSDVCKVGDFNGDGRDELVAFSRATASYGNIFVTLSSSSSGVDRFMETQVWNGYFCVGSEVCEVGDFNGDQRDDIALFIRSAYGDTARAGDVEVALSTGGSTSGLFIPTGYLWHNFFCIGNESCQTGDFNGDGVDDIVAFTKGSSADVYVELSNRSSFGDGNAPAEKWHEIFCGGDEVCDVADFDGNGRDDIVTFLQSDYAGTNPETIGDVIVALSTGSQGAGGFVTLPKWVHYFCIGNEICETGDFNGDGLADIAAFSRGSYGYVYVALARIGTGYYFADTPGTPPTPPVSKWLLPLFIRRTGQ